MWLHHQKRRAMSDNAPENFGSTARKPAEILSFKEVGHPIPLETVADEFEVIRACLKNPLTPEIATRVCQKSGTHLVKLVSARADGDHACLNIRRPDTNEQPAILPSVNAPDIPFAKVLYRPLEIIGRPSRSVIDDIRNPDDQSDQVLQAFAYVFGANVLQAIKDVFLQPALPVSKLAAGEFPIIFVPRPDGRDLQITPVSPATAFMGVKGVWNDLYDRKKAAGLVIAHGASEGQSISSKPQNISGAIGGPRRRIVARMPAVLDQGDADLHRYIQGGSFPRWREDAVRDWVLRYADLLDADKIFNNSKTRAALDRTADRLIRSASDFIEETVAEARVIAGESGVDLQGFPRPIDPVGALMRRWWVDGTREKARKALTSAHFEHRLSRMKGVSVEGSE